MLIINTSHIISYHIISYLKYYDNNDFYGQAVSQRVPLGDFKWVEETSQFNEDLIKN